MPRGRYGVAIATVYEDTCLAGLASFFLELCLGFFLFSVVGPQRDTVTSNGYFYYYFWVGFYPDRPMPVARVYSNHTLSLGQASHNQRRQHLLCALWSK